MYAVIKTGGKQYRVAAADTILVEKLDGAAGDAVAFGEVLMVADGAAIEIGAPFIAGATVRAEIVAQARGPKIIIFKKKRRKHYRRKNGHRQDLTSVRITDILTGGAKPEPARAEPAPQAATPVEAAAPMPLASPEPAGQADDLSLIGGVGPKINQTLAGMGYTTYRQIAELDEAQAAEIEAAIKMKGRVAREEWREQARELMAGQPPRAKADRQPKSDPQE